MNLPSQLSTFDILAAAIALIAWYAIGWLVENPPKSRPSVSVIMINYRREWLRHFVMRTPRIFDATVISSLRQGTTFFVSACMIAIGGGVALIGNATRLETLASDLPISSSSLPIELRLTLALLFLSNALLKFIWAHRLFGYCAILMAAVPNNADHPLAYHRASQAAEVNITAGKSFNRGMRSIYFALAAAAWLAGPWALLLGTLASSLMLLRREFASQSRLVILQNMPEEDA